MGTIYLVAAGLTGAIVGYTIARFESKFETKVIQSAHVSNASSEPAFESTIQPIERIEPIPPVRVISIGNEKPAEKSTPAKPPVDDLELAARRYEERARTADRLGDPKLADLWRNEAAKLRAAAAERLITAKPGQD